MQKRFQLSSISQRESVGTVFLGQPVGDWATWFGSVGVVLTLGFIAAGTLKQGKEFERQTELDRSSQARLVGGWISDMGEEVGRGPKRRMTVQNASPLAVRRVHGYLFPAGSRECIGPFEEIPVLRPGESYKDLVVPYCPPKTYFVLVFDDDAGIRWRKYTGKLVSIDPEKPDLDGWTTNQP